MLFSIFLRLLMYLLIYRSNTFIVLFISLINYTSPPLFFVLRSSIPFFPSVFIRHYKEMLFPYFSMVVWFFEIPVESVNILELSCALSIKFRLNEKRNKIKLKMYLLGLIHKKNDINLLEIFFFLPFCFPSFTSNN